MIKAIFLDYTGTIVQEGGPELMETVVRLRDHSTLPDAQAVLREWWTLVKEYEEKSFGEQYLTEDEIAFRALEYFEEQFDLKDDKAELLDLIRGFWVNAPIFPDAREFFQRCTLPIYVISNNGARYVQAAMEQKELQPAALVCADSVRAYKPHRKLFEHALEVSGCSAEEALHVGDSLQSDIQGAAAAGIRAVLVRRDGQPGPDGVPTVKALTEVLDLL